jgi:C4-dicarboxylate-specific signal transduction histidine kinase
LGSATLKLVDSAKRRLTRVEIHDVIKGVLETFKPFLEGRDVTVELQLAPGSPYLRGSEAAVESIITNLINNSLVALEKEVHRKRLIRIETKVAGLLVNIRVMDNGPGIEGISISDIWLPGQTTRRNGTGLGLTIVHDSVVDMGGEVDAIEHGELGGAEIIIELPILGV